MWDGLLDFENRGNDFIFLCHLVIAAVFFSSYFLFNYVLIVSTDVLNLNFPVLLWAKRNFLVGEPGLWNSYLLMGTSTFATSNAPQFSPDNWLHFL
ncbi:MAG: hypothetical protein GWM98_24790, partial [Nitrospinaceae bacterium]|nr:hypothetical protein [Nitrospinaceae bacterium]NIR57094.1 hypothetical protein [Nitrospinaceae bacterium]NIS87535.1 hypothetical protein [Nitrospinaceae bacterium]NIT84405.1 hypothetical protein [Nitrospinaceae bacterium]NIU46592.1 hypothetical protein [Nitrospinaceae bacterium]